MALREKEYDQSEALEQKFFGENLEKVNAQLRSCIHKGTEQ